MGEELLWEGLVPIPAVKEFTYRLAVVNEAFEVLKWASQRHTVVLPEGLEDGAIGARHRRRWRGFRGAPGGQRQPASSTRGHTWTPAIICLPPYPVCSPIVPTHPPTCPAVDVDEVWTDEGHPSLVLARSAFARVVWRNRCTAGGGRVLRLQPLLNEVVVRFQVQ